VNNHQPDAVGRLAFTMQEAAAALAISVPTIQRAISHNLIRSMRMGRAIRLPADEVQRLARDGIPKIPRDYRRKTSGPTKQGRPLGSKNKPKPAKRASRRKATAERERRVQP
jgi:excisionase family DNA binding protein